MKNDKKTILSGVKPTGRPHIGNFFGAMKQLVEMQDDYQEFVMIADYHALTTVQNAEEMRNATLDLAIDYLALGLDPTKAVLFRQSDVAPHTELAWIFNCITKVSLLQQAHAYKAAVDQERLDPKGTALHNKMGMPGINVGTFDYPLLMAADILLYDADLVPVGQDQKQHVEIARDTAEKFNRLFGETFKLPEPLILKDVGVIAGNDGRKMSKSYGNHLPLFSGDEEIKKFVMGIKTDSKGVEEPKNPDECNVFALHKLFSQEQLPELKKRYEQGGIGYKESKEILLANIINFIAPLRAKREEIAKDKKKVLEILVIGAEKARAKAMPKMEEAREKIGISR